MKILGYKFSKVALLAIFVLAFETNVILWGAFSFWTIFNICWALWALKVELEKEENQNHLITYEPEVDLA